MEAEESAFSMALPHGVFHRGGRPSAVSARKLAASLWSDYSPRSHLQSRPSSSISNSDSPDSMRCSSSKASKPSTRNPSPTTKSPTVGRLRMTAPPLQRYPFRSNSISSDIAALELDSSGGYQCSVSGLRTSGSDSRKAFCSPRSTEKTQIESSSLVIGLSEELKRALARVKELELAQVSARNEVDSLLKMFADEISLLRTNEQERIQSAVYSISEQLEKERKLRKKLEVKNRELYSYLGKVEETIGKVEEQLEQERKARKLMEDVCDELAKEIGEDKVLVEALRREQVSARTLIEYKQKTPDTFGQERSDMNFSDATIELEENCMDFNIPKPEVNRFLSSMKAQSVDISVEFQGRCLSKPMEELQNETSGSTQFNDFTLSLNDISSRSKTYQSQHNKSSMEESEQRKKASIDVLSAVEKKWLNNSLSSGHRDDDAEVDNRNKAKDLSERDFEEGSCRYEMYNDRVEREYRRKHGNKDALHKEEEASNWSADCEDESEDWRQSCEYALQSGSDEKFFVEGNSEVRPDSGLHNAETVCKHDLENSECSCDEDVYCSVTCQGHPIFLQMNQDTSRTDKGVLSSGYYLVDQPYITDSDSRFQKQKRGLKQSGNYSATERWRASARSSAKGSKSIRSNSLRAKLILEDEMGD